MLCGVDESGEMLPPHNPHKGSKVINLFRKIIILCGVICFVICGVWVCVWVCVGCVRVCQKAQKKGDGRVQVLTIAHKMQQKLERGEI